LTVVIVSYQCCPSLLRCLASLRRQVGAPEMRIVVVDNASRDGTVATVRQTHPDVTVIPNSRNVGFGAATNQGLALADEGPVLVLNPDTEVPPTALAQCLARLDELPAVGVLGCKLVRADGTVDRASRRNVPTPRNSLAYIFRLDRVRGPRQDSYNPPAELYDIEGEAGALCGAFMLVRREALDEVKGFDEDFWMYGEDLDWSIRFREAGWGVHYLPTVSVLHLKGGSSGATRSLRVTYEFSRAMWVFFDKHRPPSTSPLLLALVRAGIVLHLVVNATRSLIVRQVLARARAVR